MNIKSHINSFKNSKNKILLTSLIVILLLNFSCNKSCPNKSYNSDGSYICVSAQNSSSNSNSCAEDEILSRTCSANSGKILTSIFGDNLNLWNNPEAGTTVKVAIPNGYYSSKQCLIEDQNLISTNIANGLSIFGVTGTYKGHFSSNMGSNALRDAGLQVIPNLAGQTTSNQITLENEQTTYASADLPTTNAFNYRDIPDMTKDDEGYNGTTCKYAPRPANNCGTTQNTIPTRVADCAIQNPSTSTWDGATYCNGGEGKWKLVTKTGANKEVWQDQRTGQLWSSAVTSGTNWCQASGNTQTTPLTFINSFNNAAGSPIIGNGTISSLLSGTTSAAETITITFTSSTTFTVSGANCGGGSITSGSLTTSAGSAVTWSRLNYCSFTLTQGSTNFAIYDTFTLQSVNNSIYSCFPGSSSGLQPASPVSYCTEDPTFNSTVGENWGAGVYMAAKGGMGKTPTIQSPSVRWRLPSIKDYKQADLNGIRFVMPDMGLAGSDRPSSDGSVGGNYEWSASLVSSQRSGAWGFSSNYGYPIPFVRNNIYTVRCLGR